MTMTIHAPTYEFLSATHIPPEQTEPAYWFLFQGDQLIVTPTDNDADQDANNSAAPLHLVDPADVGLFPFRRQFMGYLEEEGRRTACYSGELLRNAALPAQFRAGNLRQLYEELGDKWFGLAGRAAQLVAWDATHQFCGRCGSPLSMGESERIKKCGQCGLTSYPRIAPAIIIAVTRQIDGVTCLLLARNHRFPPNRYSIIAGFVEPGETLEECCAREVREETGIEIDNIRYIASQPWPFPNSLMLGFTAEYAGGDIVLEEAEIADARWFTPDDLPLLPPKPSIARRLIDAWLAEQGRL